VRKLIVVAAALALSGCSTSPAQLEEKAQPNTQVYSENYQEIYRRVSGPAKRCIAGNIGAYASMAVDADLFSDLGYGQAIPLDAAGLTALKKGAIMELLRSLAGRPESRSQPKGRSDSRDSRRQHPRRRQ
jgi:hypothetical protein